METRKGQLQQQRANLSGKAQQPAPRAGPWGTPVQSGAGTPGSEPSVGQGVGFSESVGVSDLAQVRQGSGSWVQPYEKGAGGRWGKSKSQPTGGLKKPPDPEKCGVEPGK